MNVPHTSLLDASTGTGNEGRLTSGLSSMQMRINLALPGLAGLAGGMRVAAQYAAHLSSKGHLITLLVRRPEQALSLPKLMWRRLGLGSQIPPLPDQAGHFEGLGLPVVHLDENRRLRHKQVPDADIILSTFWTTAEWAGQLPRSKGRHIHFIQDYEFFDPHVGSRVKAVYDKDNAKIVVANWLQQAIHEHHGKTSIIVPNGVDTARFTAHDRSVGHPSRVGFLYSGMPRKNVQLAIQALERARTKDPSLQAISFGAKPRPQYMPEWIVYEQRPSQDRIPQIYASCDLWLFPSLSEGFGLPLLEAMASGTPVLAARAGAAPDLIDGTNGWLVEADPEVMARSLLHFLARPPEQWLAASRAARHTAEAHDVACASQAFEDVLLSLIDQPQGT